MPAKNELKYNEKDIALMRRYREVGFTLEELYAIFDEEIPMPTIQRYTKSIKPDKTKKEAMIVKLRDLFLSWGEGKPLEELPLSPEFIRILKDGK